MIGYLEGPIQSLEPDRVVVVCGGVGYIVNIPLSTYYKLEASKTAALQIHTHVREDALALFGFSTREEKATFEKLISISGIGPRLAQVILSGIDVYELAQAVATGDVRRLSSIPGVGKKTSERLCLELRDKLIFGSPPETRSPLPARSSTHDDAVSALVNLGYKPVVAESAVKSAREALGDDVEFSKLLRAALSKLAR
ncbi:MAG: Holliday junction branch migration protein RuvA [Thermoanaerobaculia bacterium]|nr:Holliday junction branch migration protein RuvA [Thermoanaerobaculia bacterium]